MVTSFYTDVIQKSPLYTSVKQINTLDLLEPNFKAKVEALIAESVAKGRPMKVFETYRSSQRQVQLFEQHLTELKNVGVHHYGLAADIAFVDGDGLSWKGDFTFLRNLAVEQGLVSGYDWGNSKIHHSFRDMDHVQAINVSDQNKLFAGTWYPDNNYKPVIV